MGATLRSSRRRKTRQAFAAGVSVGFFAGALLTAVVIFRFGSTFGAGAAALDRLSSSQRTASRSIDGRDDAGPAVLEGDARAEATTGHEPSSPAASPAPAIGPPADSPEELAGRDLAVPVDGVRPDQLVRSFSDARGERRHEALDILAPEGTPVRAVEDGKVARLFLSKAGGITVYQFDPSERYCFYYAHLQRYANGLREGQRVSRGDVIGYVGTTGNAPKDTPHLHFAIFRLTREQHWWEGTPIDPYDVLR